MLRQQTAGPSNKDSNNTTQDLAAALAEIEQLRVQLVEQGTPQSRNELLDTLKLATALEALSQRLARPSEAFEHTKKSAKILDPPILIDSKDPTFKNWKLQV